MPAIEVDSTMDEYMAAISFTGPDRSYPLPYEDSMNWVSPVLLTKLSLLILLT
jgi:hypothetical protein